jgi:hypothetical protein
VTICVERREPFVPVALVFRRFPLLEH